MGKKMKKTDGFKSYPMLGVAVAVAIFMTGCASAPTIPAPTEQMALSHAAINSANSAGGSEYAPVQLKSMGTKNYSLARQLAEEAQVDAQLAAAAARAGKAQKAADALRESDRVLHKELDRSAK
jgi:hypothetical protein